jgi:Leucine-rich repeat (LRR) protein
MDITRNSMDETNPDEITINTVTEPASETQEETSNISKEVQERVNEQRGSNILDLSNLGLTELPPISEDVNILYCNNNLLESIPDNLPSSIQIAMFNNNRISSITEFLPDSINNLHLDTNYITSLPQHLPANLMLLDIDKNQLTELNTSFPNRMEILCVSENQLSVLPENLPDSLQILFYYGNSISSLPQHVPSSLRCSISKTPTSPGEYINDLDPLPQTQIE